MRKPLHHRQSIPFFYDKSETEFQQDSYERFDSMVLRQSALHLADELWGNYPWQPIMDFAKGHLPESASNIAEIGCSTGRWIADVARTYPKGNCWGLDYSYQMLKRANEFWCEEKSVYLDVARFGFHQSIEVKGQKIQNLKFGLAKAGDLPFDSDTQDLLLHSFLIDRVHDVRNSLIEMHRVLKRGGTMIFATPLNFQRRDHWVKYYPAIRIYKLMEEIGFEIKDWNESLRVSEPLDMRGNSVSWICVGVVAVKR